ncbi:MAG: signal peptide peptidase SppA [Nitrospirae bacterium]|nr:signal peptide peptidase SppA [Nitrospirota bacterium]
MKRPVAVIVIGSIVALVVLMAFAAAASLFLGGAAPVAVSDKVALVNIEGVILDSEDVIKQLKEYSENDSVKAIVLRIDSPGGAVVPSQEIYAEVRKLKANSGQKVVTSMGSVAASGGYYIAAASDRIMANPGSLTGSIGVIMEFATAEELMNKIGLKEEVIKSGARKDVGNFMRSMTPEDRAYLQAVIDDVHDQFVEAVAKGRRMKKEDVALLADGGIFTGRKAKEVGLVDELGDLDDAVKLAGKLGGIEGEPKIITEEKKYSVWDMLKGEDMGNIFKGFFNKNFQSLMYLYTAPSMH